MLPPMRAILGLVAVTGVAHADPVNLLTHTDATVEVSSSVNSDTFLPQHLVDGDLQTAWNSASDDPNPWVAFEVPANAHVDSVRLTVGFTKGAWFKQNHRISAIEVTGGDRAPMHVKLDPNSDKLQELVINSGGGRYRLRVESTEPGTNKDWDEIVISELEVWGTTAAPLAKPKTPRVTIGAGSSKVDCVHVLWPKAKGGRVTATEGVTRADWSAPVCTVERRPNKSKTHTTTLALVKGLVVTDKLEKTWTEAEDSTYDAHHLRSSELVLGSEPMLLVEDAADYYGDMTGSQRSTFTLYRHGTGKLVPVASWDTRSETIEMFSKARTCSLQAGKPEKPMPELVLTCADDESGYEAKDNKHHSTVMKLHWKGTAYDVPEAAHLKDEVPY